MAEVFYGLAVLACPVGMGVMMWIMMRGRQRPTADSPTPESEISVLRAEVEQLRDAQREPASQARPTPSPGKQRSPRRGSPVWSCWPPLR